uniref:Uncharacterized protein n=1 Tax=Knipowitschia caucasica TaxID=637954 RepID=A0AAV2MK63_KNICA
MLNVGGAFKASRCHGAQTVSSRMCCTSLCLQEPRHQACSASGRRRLGSAEPPSEGAGPRPAGRGVLPQEGPIKSKAQCRPWAEVQWEKAWLLVQSAATFTD